MDDSIHAINGEQQEQQIRQIAFTQFDIQPFDPIYSWIVRQNRSPKRKVPVEELSSQPAAHLTGDSGDKDSHSLPTFSSCQRFLSP